MENEKSNFSLIAIISIVGIVALVVLINGNKNKIQDTDQVLLLSSDEITNTIGEVYEKPQDKSLDKSCNFITMASNQFNKTGNKICKENKLGNCYFGHYNQEEFYLNSNDGECLGDIEAIKSTSTMFQCNQKISPKKEGCRRNEGAPPYEGDTKYGFTLPIVCCIN